MMRNMVFVWALISFCSGCSSVIGYTMQCQASSDVRKLDAIANLTKPTFKKMDLLYCCLSYRNCIFNLALTDHTERLEKLILELYNFADKHNKLCLLDSDGKPTGDKAEDIWKQVQPAYRNIPADYQQSCLSIILELVDDLLQTKPKYARLYKRLMDFERHFKDEDKQRKPTYNDEMAYVKKLLMEHFDELNEATFYAEYGSSAIPSPYVSDLDDSMLSTDVGRWDSTMPSAWPVAWYSGSKAIRKGFQAFFLNLKKIK
ncbi:hypothetical protein [Cardinium endosymbiont of Sogatella furcifera]|uniref:hypothetical protein n=1 Tax=Cardinium endosymbiont of Sogatella furcifera TaxID=650378 RepID=UPI0013B421E1|nr:hypothetical protein [Cardinium endosymbiont of Sogatella furcifera]